MVSYVYNELEYRIAFERFSEPDKLFSLTNGKQLHTDLSCAKELGSVRFVDLTGLKARGVLRQLHRRNIEMPSEANSFEYTSARRLYPDGIRETFFADYNVRIFKI